MMKNVRITAPKRPPNNEETNAADKARAACPFLASGNPSKTVAWDELEPGMPIRTDAKVSEVGITATSPTIIARPDTGSIPYKNGKTKLRPAMPPSPGKTPTDRPNKTPMANHPIWVGVKISAKASLRAGRAVAKTSNGLAQKRERHHGRSL